MEQFLLSVLEAYGYAGMFFLIMVESVFPPIPSEVILLFGGVLSIYTDLSGFGMVLAATAGALAGAWFLYFAGTFLAPDRLDGLMEKPWVRFLGFKGKDIQKSLDWFEKYQSFAVLLGRCIPIVRSLVSIPAGMNRMSLLPFTVFTATGSFFWNTVLIYLGRMAGESWESVKTVWDESVNGVLLVLLAVFVLVKAVKKKHPPADR